MRTIRGLGTAARAVADKDPSQFRRELVRLFSARPVDEADETRNGLVAG